MNRNNLKNLPRVINFSGGRTSAYMTIMLNPTPDDIVLFTDTKREHPKTYEFIDNFEKHEGIKVHRATYTHSSVPGLEGFDALMARKTYLPNREQRLCTDELKVKTAKRYLRGLGIQRFENYIGFRADESDRVKNYENRYVKTIPKFVLHEWGINEAMVLGYWENKPYNLEIPRILGNCDLCFLKGKNAIIRILQHFPELAEPWIKDENRGGRRSTYIKDTTYADLLKIAQSQLSLFDESKMELLEPAYSCSCNSL